MDPYCLSVEREASKNIEENERENFKDAIVSSRSLNKGYVEKFRLKTAIPEIAACIIAASFHIGVGISMAYSAILVPALEAPDADIVANKSQTSWMASIVVIATPVGALLGSFLMEWFGRLRTLQLGTIPYTLGWVLIATSDGVGQILVGRLLSGLATALAASPAVVYITEVARPELRGSLVSLGPTLASLGILLVYLMGAFLHWRTVAWLGIAYGVLPVLLVQFIVPESPSWLVSKGRTEQARASLVWLHRCRPSVSADAAFAAVCKERDLKTSEANARGGSGGHLGKLRALARPTGWRPMFVLFLLFLFQQFSGIYITLFYAVTWFKEIDSGVDPYLASVLVGLTRFLCSMVNTWLLRRFRRRLLCIVSSLGMAACMAVSGYFTWRIVMHSERNCTWVPVLCLLLYVCASMVGLLTIPWTMTAELFPSEVREFAHAISYSIANLLMFGAVQSYRDLANLLGGSHAIQWFFAAVSIGAAFYVWLLLPETHGRTLTEIEDHWKYNSLLVCGGENKAKTATKKRAAQKKAQTALLQPLTDLNTAQIA